MPGVYFCGQPAVLDVSKTLERFTAQRWPESRWPAAHDRLTFELTADPFSGTNSARFHLPYPDIPAPRLNEVIIPTGATRYGRGLFVFGREQMAAIAGQLWGYAGDLSYIPLSWGLSNTSGILELNYQGSFTWPMFALPPVRLDATGGNNLWLLPLVDIRYSVIRDAILTQSTQGETWTQIVNRISNPAFPPANFQQPPASAGVPDRETFDNPGLGYSVAMETIALSIGYRVVPRFVSNGLVCWFDSSQGFNPNVAPMAPWMGGELPANIHPASVRFIGRAVVDHSNECKERYPYSHSFAFGNGPLRPTIHSPWFVRHFRERVSGTPEIVVDAAAAEKFRLSCVYLAETYAAWNNRSYAASLPGIHPWQLTGRDDYVSYRVAGTDDPDAVSTHIQSLPPNFYPITSLCQDPEVYVHPTDSAVFRLTFDEDDDGWAEAQIVVADGPYFGSDRRPILLRVISLDCLPPLKECDQILCHYQCSVDLGGESGLPGWVYDAFAQKLDGFEIEATLDESLTGNDGTGSAEFVKVRSTFPHVLEPPGIDELRKIEFQNPWKIDGICNSPVILQLVTDACRPPVDESGEEIVDCDYTNTPTPRWEIRDAARRRARMILFQYTGGTPEILDYWYGEDPESCGDPVVVVYPLGEPCEPCEVYADLDPHSGVYVAHATRSAMLGEPEEIDFVSAVAYDDTGCAINYVRQSILAFPCGSEPELGTTEPTLQSIDVVTNAYLVPPVPACEGYAEYTWNPATSSWVLTTPCASGCVSSPPASPPADPSVAGSPVQSPCSNPENNPAAPGYLAFTRSTILVCGYNSASPATIELAECPPTEP
jgi:hypothetical protein